MDRLYVELQAIGATIEHPPREYPEYTPAGYYALYFKDLEGISTRSSAPPDGGDALMLEQLLVLVSVTCLVMVIPGPDMVLVLRNTFVGGRRAGLRTSCGVLAGNLVHITYGLLGIGWLIAKSILAFAALKYAAAAYLIYLGVMSLRSGGTTLEVAVSKGDGPVDDWFLQGFVSNVLEPEGRALLSGSVHRGHRSRNIRGHHAGARLQHDAGERLLLAAVRLDVGSAGRP